ncbi:hypothetical protein SAMN05878503_103117 [Cereibacter ovatus]|uniref:Divergent polysaccharide deacetylase n=1 Tax=Cereibacter ovatus TaxID=439529 RepID=A0A285CNI2_9RHOB|nr:divergent polysaccharide deacetylase family protein [Cereibacter ovatus]SNX69130.1 hypothetical protein SAMN05878503_103117 [Cereibacter ovatus]
MSRGFLSGIVMGGVVGCVGLAVASQIARPPGTTWTAAAPQATAAPQPGMVAPPAEAPPADLPSATAPAAAVPATDLSPPAGSEFARPLPEAAPVLPGADGGLARGAAPAVSVPAAAESLAPDTASAARPQPVPLEPAAPAAPAVDADAPARAPLPLAGGGVVRLAEAPQPGVPMAEARPSAADLPPPPPLTPEEEAMIAKAAGEAALPPVAPSAVPTVEAPATPRMLEPDPAKVPGAPVLPGRLPRIGETDAADAAPADDADLPPIRRHARAFANPDRKPAFAILLRDTGGPGLDREALAGLPFPVSFVIDPQAPDAAVAAAIYRAAGQEVLMLATGLPEAARPADAEVTLEAAAVALPEAVALVDLPQGGGFQGARSLSTQVVEILAAQGRGIVTHDRGLNAADQVARREGLPAVQVFRSLDAGQEDAQAVRRTLDRAAFKAAQDGQVVVMGDTRPETVKALLEWTVEGRADTVALAPATAVMR